MSEKLTEDMQAYKSAWREANKDKVKAANQKYREAQTYCTACNRYVSTSYYNKHVATKLHTKRALLEEASASFPESEQAWQDESENM